MKLFSVLVTVGLAVFASALPMKRQGIVVKSGNDPIGRGASKTFTDIDVLQYLLYFEHTENALYAAGMANYTAEDFANAGYSSDIYGRFQQIVYNEATHVEAYTAAIIAAGADPAPACTYHFAVSNVQEFVAATRSLENVDAASRSEAAFLIEDPTLAALVGAMYGTEARQAAWIAASVFNENPWNTPFETHLNFRQVNTLGKGFVVSCPDNTPFILGASDGFFPTLAVHLDMANSTAIFDFDKPTGALAGQPLYAAFIQGNMTAFAPIDATTGSVALPAGLRGYVYGLVTSEFGVVLDNVTVAGPATLQFPFDANAEVINTSVAPL
jgi:hypothetical protein